MTSLVTKSKTPFLYSIPPKPLLLLFFFPLTSPRQSSLHEEYCCTWNISLGRTHRHVHRQQLFTWCIPFHCYSKNYLCPVKRESKDDHLSWLHKLCHTCISLAMSGKAPENIIINTITSIFIINLRADTFFTIKDLQVRPRTLQKSASVKLIQVNIMKWKLVLFSLLR